MTLVEPTRNQVLEYCAREPVERVFLEDVARRGFGRFVGSRDRGGERSTALCHSGANLVPSGEGCEAFAGARRQLAGAHDHRRGARGRRALAARRDDAPAAAARGPARASPSTRSTSRRRPASPACAPATRGRPRDPRAGRARLRTSSSSASTRSTRDADGFRWRTSTQIEEGRSWLWLEDGVVLVQGGGVGVDALGRPARAGLGRPRGARPRLRARRGLRRPLPAAARLGAGRDPVRPQRERRRRSALYEEVGMRKVLEYRSVLF